MPQFSAKKLTISSALRTQSHTFASGHLPNFADCTAIRHKYGRWHPATADTTVVAGPVEADCFGHVLIQALTIGAIPDLATGRRIIAESFPPTVIEPSTDRAAWDVHLAGFVGLPR